MTVFYEEYSVLSVKDELQIIEYKNAQKRIIFRKHYTYIYAFQQCEKKTVKSF